MDRDTYLRIVDHIETILREEYPYGGSQEEKWAFFSRLDESYREPWIVDSILEWMLWYPNLVLTGGFGEYVVERLEARRDDFKFNYILYNGRLRSGEKPSVLGMEFRLRAGHRPWVLFDDSHYSGRTRFIISSHMQYAGMDVNQSVIIYDGCTSWNPHVAALYRWYMVHGLREFPVKEND